jgi:hypothetical protein
MTREAWQALRQWAILGFIVPMKIFFDVDLTMLYVDAVEDRLRPGVREAFEALTASGHKVYVWSAGGEDYSRRIVHKYGLADLVVDCFDKDVTVPIKPDVVIDDDWHIVKKYGGHTVKAYRDLDEADGEMARIVDAIRSTNGHSAPGGA